MTGITSIALMGLFAWSGTGLAAFTPPLQIATATEAHVAERTLSVRTTGYNAVPEQTDSDPTTTASGAYSNPDIIAARSRDLAEELPFGTVITLEAPQKSFSCGFNTVAHLIGYRVIADTMNDRMHQKVDIMFDQADKVMIGVDGNPKKATNPARALGVCNVTVRIVGKISIKDIPATQSELAVLVKHALAVR